MKSLRMTRLNLAVHAAAWLVLAYLAWAWFSNNLGINPIQVLEQRTGDYALILLLLSLVCTPVNTLFGFRQAIKLRRPLGVYAFMYAAIHLLLFVGLDYGFNFRLLLLDVADKRYIFVGLTAFLLLLPLAFTSYDYWKKRLGKTWKRLHKLVYLAAPLVVIHLAWVVKGNVTSLQGDIWKPVLAGVVTALLLAARLTPVRKWMARMRQHGRRVSPAAVDSKKKPGLDQKPGY